MAGDWLPAAAAHDLSRRASRRTNRPLRDARSEADDPGPLTVQPAPVRSEVSPRQPDGTMFVRAGRDWTGAAAGRVRALFDRAYRQRPTLLIADLAGVAEMDLAGIRALIAARRRFAASGCALELQNLTPHLRRQLESTGHDRVPLSSTAASPSAPERTGPEIVGEQSLDAAAV